MKKTLLVLLMAIIANKAYTQQIHTIPVKLNDAQKAGLKGKVKTVLELSVRNLAETTGDTIKCACYNAIGEITNIKRKGMSIVIKKQPMLNKQFNTNNQLIAYNQDGKKYVLKYNSANKLVEATEYDKAMNGYTTTKYTDGKIVRNEEYGGIGGGKYALIDLYTYNYNALGYEVTMTEKNISGLDRPLKIYNYDTHDNLIKEVIFDPETNKMSSVNNHMYHYDENGGLIYQQDENITYPKNGNSNDNAANGQVQRVTKARFITDDKGNWTQMIFNSQSYRTNESTSSITKRFITYYN